MAGGNAPATTFLFGVDLNQDIKIEDWARLAAYIDGEGTIQVARRKKGTAASISMMISVFNTDIRLPLYLKETFGGKVFKNDRMQAHPRTKVLWTWWIGSYAAADLLEHCLPFFIMKRDQAEIAIAFQRTVGRHAIKCVAGSDGRVRRTVPEEVQEQREKFMQQLLDVRDAVGMRIQ